MVKKLWVALVLALFPPTADATLLLRANFEQLVAGSERIFLGTVLSVREEPPTAARSFPSVITTFRVEEGYLGSFGAELSLRQLGKADRRSPLNLKTGIPLFSVGDRAVIFLPKASRLGFATPVGFGQGVFRIAAGEKRDPFVANQFGNRALFRNVEGRLLRGFLSSKGVHDVDREIPLTLSELKDLIGRAKGERR